MMLLKKLWVALSIVAFGSMAIAPVLAFADTPAQGLYDAPSGGVNSPSPSGGVNSPSPSGGVNSPSPSGGVNSPSSGQSVGGLQNPLGAVTGVCQLLKIVLNVAILTGIPIAMFFLVYAGFKLTLARGNPTELERAKANLWWTIVGIAIFVGIWFLVQVIANTLGALGVQVLGSCR